MYETFFAKSVYEAFGPQVKEYLEENSLPLKRFLVMDNATDYLQMTTFLVALISSRESS